MTKTFTIRGQKLRTSSNRRYVAYRFNRRFDGVRYVADAIQSVEIFKRSDSVGTLRTHIQRQGFHSSRFFVIVDTVTGEEV